MSLLEFPRCTKSLSCLHLTDRSHGKNVCLLSGTGSERHVGYITISLGLLVGTVHAMDKDIGIKGQPLIYDGSIVSSKMQIRGLGSRKDSMLCTQAMAMKKDIRSKSNVYR